MSMIESMERRRLLTTTVTYTPTDSGGNPQPPVSFNWDVQTQGRSVVDSPTTQRSLLLSAAGISTNQVFLRLDNITGEVSGDPAHNGQIQLLSYEWGSDRVTPAGAGPDFNSLHLVGNQSKASALLMSRCATGTIIPTGDLYLRSPSNSVEFLHIALTDIQISSYNITTSQLARLAEEYTLTFKTVDVTYIPVINNVAQPPVEFAWNVPTQGRRVNAYAPSTASTRSIIEDTYTPAPIYQMTLRLDNIPGESIAAKHTDEIDLYSFEWGVQHAPGSTGPAVFNQLHFVAPLSVALPRLLAAEKTGATIPNGDITIIRSGGAQGTVFTLDFSSAAVATHRLSTTTAGLPLEEFTLTFNDLNLSTFQLDSKGGTAGSNSFSFTLPTNGASVAGGAMNQRALLTVPATPVGYEMFLRLDNIPGDGSDAKHPDNFSMSALEWDVASPGAGGAGGAPVIGDIHVVSHFSKASPLLMAASVTGGLIGTGDVTFSKSGASQYDFMNWHLFGIAVTSYRQSTAVDGQIREEFTLSFRSNMLNYSVADSRGTIVQTIGVLYDLDTLGGTFNHFAAPHCAVLTSTITSATDQILLHLDGITGESADAKHPNDIDLLGFEFGMNGSNYHELHVVTNTSKASPQLLAKLTTGGLIASGDITVIHSGAEQYTYYTAHLDNLLVSSYRIASQSISAIREEFTFSFGDVTINYVPLTGGAGSTFASGPIPTGNVQDFAPTQRSVLTQGPTPTSLNLWMDITGIVGQSIDAKHPTAIDLRSFEWTADAHPGSALPPQFGELHAAQVISKATPQLMQALAQGTVLTNANLTARKNGASQFTFLKLNLVNAQVSSHRISDGTGTILEETTFSFNNVGQSYIPQLANGASGTPVTFTYDIPTNGGSVQDFAQTPRSLLYNNLITPPPGIDAFLTLTGIQGESQVAKHENEIDVLAFEWGADRVTAGANVGGPDFAELRLITRVDRSLTSLLAKLGTGVPINLGRLLLTRPSIGVNFLSLDLNRVVVSSHQVLDNGINGNGALQEIVLSFDQAIDTTRPSVVSRQFAFQTAQQIQYSFSENVGQSLSRQDFVVQNLTTGQIVPSTQLVFSYDFDNNIATLTAPNATLLGDGNYRVTLDNTAVTDNAGNLLLPDTPLDFFILAGDANRDRRVDVTDLGILATNWQLAGGFTRADFNYDGHIDVTDLGILATNWQRNLPALSLSKEPAFAAPTALGFGLASTTISAAKSSTRSDSEPSLVEQLI